MGITIDTIIKDGEQSIKQKELFIKAHQKNMEIGEIEEYQYYIERDKLVINIMRKYQDIQEIINNAKDSDDAVKYNWLYEEIREILENGNDE